MASNINRQKIYDKTKGKCAYCGCNIDYYDFHVDHVKSKNKNGSNKQSNLLPSCRDCNALKFNLNLEEFRTKVENLMFDTFHGRLINKYYKIKQTKIEFYFEKIGIEIMEDK